MSAQSWSPERVFPALLFGFGLLYVFAMPPGQAPDETRHYLRAYHVSEGHLFPEIIDGWGGANLPASVRDVCDTFDHLRFKEEEKVGDNAFRALWRAPLDPERRVAVSFEWARGGLFVAYLPQALAIRLGRTAGLNALGLVYAGRLADLALATLLVGLAIRLAPVGKHVLGLLALLPVAVQQQASLSPDSANIPGSLLLIAMILRVALGATPPAGWGTVAAVAALSAWLTALKVTLAPLTLFCLAVPRAHLGSWRRYLLGGAAISLAVLGAYLAVQAAGAVAGGAAPDDEGRPQGAAPQEQMELLRSNPVVLLRVVGNTCVRLAPALGDWLFTLGWLDTPMPPSATYPYLVLLVLVALIDRSPGPSPTLRTNAAALATFVAGSLLICLAMYVAWTPFAGDVVLGVQGRYFVPLLPLVLLPLASVPLPPPRMRPHMLTAQCAAAVVFVELVAIVAIVCRYYLTEPGFLSSREFPILVALLVGALFFAVTRRFAPDTEASAH
jgi:hypothetical protein